ncbi:hypothetical protein EDB83DRAFT_521198 [Lactarius deliciosus]|nr:hypothetical protein EDB83DRAFT_521198 [Lactarius deliciosus]
MDRVSRFQISISSSPTRRISQRLKNFSKEFSDFFEHLKFIILIPLSWFMTMFKFFRVIVWRLFTLPLRLFINFYERRVRERFPWLAFHLGDVVCPLPRRYQVPYLHEYHRRPLQRRRSNREK